MCNVHLVFLCIVVTTTMCYEETDDNTSGFFDYLKKLAEKNGFWNFRRNATAETQVVSSVGPDSALVGEDTTTIESVKVTSPPWSATLGPNMFRACRPDVAPDCAQKAEYCTNPIYIQLMYQKCDTTCAYCVCEDMDDRCETFAKNGFCASVFYEGVSDVLCPRSCRICGVEDELEKLAKLSEMLKEQLKSGGKMPYIGDYDK